MNKPATEPSSIKTVCFQNVPPVLARALTEQLARVRGCRVAGTDESADLTIQAGADSAPVARPRVLVRAAPRQRLGDILGAIARALEEPALATAPFRIADGIFHPAEKRLRIAARDIALTERETVLLLCLSRHYPHAVARDSLLRDVWNYQDGIDTHTLETHIYRLRQKIEDDGANPRRLLTTTDGYTVASVESCDEDGNDEGAGA